MEWILSFAITAVFVGVYVLFSVLTKNRQKKYNCDVCGSRMIFSQRVKNMLKDGEMLDVYKCPDCGTQKKMPVGGAGRTR